MKKILTTAAAATLAGLASACVFNLNASNADTPTQLQGYPPVPTNISRVCYSKIDTMCVRHRRYPNSPWPDLVETRIRFVDDGQFCMYFKYRTEGIQCEDYWPFALPVINPSSQDGS